MKTCDKCSHWSTDAHEWVDSAFEATYAEQGECNLFGDSNKFDGVPPRNDVCYGWDYESYKSGVIVMAKFGCIHWSEK